MDWLQLKDEAGLKEVKEASDEKPVVIFKHSTRCSISAASLARLERSWNKEEMSDVRFYFLDILNHRPISQKVEELFEIHHESPQMLLISHGNCVFHSSHMSINYQEIKNQLGKLAIKS